MVSAQRATIEWRFLRTKEALESHEAIAEYDSSFLSD